MENISFCIPSHPAVLRAMAEYFQDLAGGMPLDTRCIDDFAGGEKAQPARTDSIPETPVPAPAEAALVLPETARAPQPATEDPDTLVACDADGLPWDARIHSSSRKQGQSGKWNLRRNVPDETRNAVIAELRAAMSAEGAPVPDTDATLTPPSGDGSLFAANPAAVTPAAAPQSGPATFADYVSQAAAYGDAASQAACLSVGLPNVPLLATRLDLIPQVWAKLTAGGAA